MFAVLSSAAPGRVAVVCAPAGSGKTMLLRSWAESLGERVAWVPVARGERDAQRFWLSVTDQLAAAAGEGGPVSRVGATPTFDGEAVVDQLLAELRGLQEPVVLVVDDLHELHSPEALAWLERLLDDLPPELAVVLATREEPRLGLHRMRLAGDLIELRGTHLRFTTDETRRLLQASGIALPDADVDLLHERTEGWAAGLRLAALSLAGHPDPERFVQEFSGSERTVAGYLLAEVLGRQPREVRELLLHTSVLDRVSGPLADFLTGGSGSEAILHDLEKANAFVTSMDAGRTWFRFHTLFADLLRLELRRTAPASIDELHRSAALWFEGEGHVVEAIRHAQAAGDWRHATRLLVDSSVTLGLTGRIGTVHGLLAAFPREARETDPELALLLAADGVFHGRPEDSDGHLELAERLAPAVADERRRSFELLVASVRLWAARRRGDLGGALEATRSLEPALEAIHRSELGFATDLRAMALMDLGVAELWELRVDEARGHLEQALELARRAGRPFLEIGCLGHLALAALLCGRPAGVSLDLTEQAVAIAEAHGWTTHPIAGTAFAVGGNVLVRLARFTTAEDWLEKAERAVGPEEPGTGVVLHSARGLLHLARGRTREALDAFRAAQRTQAVLAGHHALATEVRSRVLQTQVRLGETVVVRAALADAPEDARDVAGTRIAVAVLHLAEGEPQRALDALEPVVAQAMPTLKSNWAAIEASLLDAAAREQLGDRRGAEDSVERALELAEPEGVLLPFVLFGVRELLDRHPRHRTGHASLLATILDLLDEGEFEPRAAPAPAFDELSDAELRVLRYLPSNLKSPEIAAELFVSANTVRTHLRHIYAKLDAHSRTEAVARARELGLLAPGGR